MTNIVTKCGGCQKIIPPHLRTIVCSTCNIFFHVKCCDINKKEFLRIIANGDDWNCKNCRPPSRNKIKCFGCKKTIAQNRIPITCTKCKNVHHASCERISVEFYLKSKDWICNKCICSSMPFENIDNEKLKITIQAKDIEFGEHLQSNPAFSIQTLLDKFPGSFSCEDFSFETGVSKYYTPSEFFSAKLKKKWF